MALTFLVMVIENSGLALDDGTQISVLGGFDVGGVLVSPTDASEELEKSGYLNRGYGLLSIFSETVTFDLGIGALYAKVKGEAKDNGFDRKEIAFTTGLFTTAVRWRLAPGVEIGPALDLTFGADASFSPDIDEEAKEQAFLGLMFTKVWTDEDTYDFRANFRLMTDLTISARHVFSFGVGLALGVPLVKPEVVEKVKIQTKVKTKVKKVEKLVYQPVYVFQSDAINFEYDKAILLKESKKFLQEVGGFLAENPNIWESLFIEGHTDKTGNFDYNMRLSQDRADAVAAVLVEMGVAPERVSAKGFGPTQPLVEGDDSFSLAKNRRVELKFEGEMDQMKLGAGLDLIRRRHQKPDTCRNRNDCR